ncbi:MAG TPA: hypothetical protein VMV22_04045 [Acidimicrobiales bacterium]|nr:hypothetical protein [Acidimicrobiales bacterium]
MVRLNAADEQFVHQLPEPLAVVGIEHEHWRESYFFVTHGPDAGSDVVVVAMAAYPPRQLLDALVLGRVGGELVFRYYQRPSGDDSHTTTVGPVSVVVEEPFRRVRVVVTAADGFDADLTFTARTQAYGLRRGRLRDEAGALLWDQSHMIQSGTFTGSYRNGEAGGRVDGWLGQRDHSWGVRDHGRIPMWTWLAIQLPDGMLGVWHWELADGARVFTDGCWAPADGGAPVPVVDFHHDLAWTDDAGDAVPYGPDGAAVQGLAGTVTFALADASTVTVRGAGRWCAPYRPIYGGGQHLMAVETDDGRRGTAVYEVTGRHHHRFFPEPLGTDAGPG